MTGIQHSLRGSRKRRGRDSKHTRPVTLKAPNKEGTACCTKGYTVTKHLHTCHKEHTNTLQHASICLAPALWKPEWHCDTTSSSEAAPTPKPRSQSTAQQHIAQPTLSALDLRAAPLQNTHATRPGLELCAYKQAHVTRSPASNSPQNSAVDASDILQGIILPSTALKL